MEKLAKSKVSFGLSCRVDDTLPGVENLGVVDRLIIESSENSNSLGVSTLSDEPSGRFR